MLDGGDHEIAHILALEALGGCEMTHGFPVAAIEREGDPDLFAIVAADLKAVGAPAQIGARDSDAAVVTALDPASMTVEQKASRNGREQFAARLEAGLPRA